MAKKRPFMKMSPEVSKGLGKAKNAPARTYAKNPTINAPAPAKGLPDKGMMGAKGPSLNAGAQNAKNAAREARKVANPKSLRGAVAQGTMTKGEAIQQATVRRAGVQVKGRAATAGRAVERGVQERAARVTTRKAGEKAAANMAARAASSSMTGRAATAGRAIAGRAAAPVAAFTTGYAIGTFLNETFDLSTKIGDYTDRVTGRAKQMEQSMITTPRGGAGSSGRPLSRGGARGNSGAPAAAAPAVTKPAASVAKPAAVKKAAPKAAPKTSTYGDDSRAQHESFRKELEAGGGRAAWSMSKQTETGGATVEISKPSSGTTLNAELDKFQAGGGKKTKKDVQLGGIAGRKDGKWHLGKKAGKG